MISYKYSTMDFAGRAIDFRMAEPGFRSDDADPDFDDPTEPVEDSEDEEEIIEDDDDEPEDEDIPLVDATENRR